MCSHAVVTNDGISLAVEERGSGPAIVFAHGLTGNKEGVFEQLGGLTDRLWNIGTRIGCNYSAAPQRVAFQSIHISR